jgi:putative chitinase
MTPVEPTEIITAARIRQIMPTCPPARAGDFAPLLANTAARFDISSPLRVAAWLAQIAEETTELSRLVESFAYRTAGRLYEVFPRDFSGIADAQTVLARGQEAIANRVYANQNGNGNEASGDGWKYRGRGCPMATGRETYTALMMGLDIDCVERPELLEEPAHAADAAGFFWKAHKLNVPADAGDIVTVSKRLNGGTNGLARRVEYYRRAVAACTT